MGVAVGILFLHVVELQISYYKLVLSLNRLLPVLEPPSWIFGLSGSNKYGVLKPGHIQEKSRKLMSSSFAVPEISR